MLSWYWQFHGEKRAKSTIHPLCGGHCVHLYNDRTMKVAAARISPRIHFEYFIRHFAFDLDFRLEMFHCGVRTWPLRLNSHANVLKIVVNMSLACHSEPCSCLEIYASVCAEHPDFFLFVAELRETHCRYVIALNELKKLCHRPP